jgi:hypothetical protein
MAAHKQSIALSVFVYINSLLVFNEQYMQRRQRIANRAEQTRTQQERERPAKPTIYRLPKSRQKQGRDDCSYSFHITPVMYII